MKSKKLFSRIAAVLTMCVMMFCNQPWTVAAAEEVQNKELATEYVSEVKVFYEVSEDAARKACEGEGYYFCPQDLKESYKDGYHAYIGYKTTKDPDDAITDMAILDMKQSYYKEMTYQEYLDKYIHDYADQANSLMVLTNNFRQMYKAGSPNAMAAMDSLNMFYVDETKPVTSRAIAFSNSSDAESVAAEDQNMFGNYILNKADSTFWEKFIQRGNAKILGNILSILSGAAADYGNDTETWAERAKCSEMDELMANASSAEKNAYNTAYEDTALTLYKQIKDFMELYNEAKLKYNTYGASLGYDIDTNLNEEDSIAAIMEMDSDCKLPEYYDAVQTYALFDNYIYQDAGEEIVPNTAEAIEKGEAAEKIQFTSKKTLAEYFSEVAADKDILTHIDKLYAIVESFTPAQREVVRLCGLRGLAKTLYIDEDYAENREKWISDAEKKLKEMGYSAGKIWIWDGVDFSIYTKKVVETSDLITNELSGQYIDNLDEKRKSEDKLSAALEITDFVVTGVMGLLMTVQGIMMLTANMTFASAAASVASIACTTIVSSMLVSVAHYALLALQFLNTFLFWASLALAVFMIMYQCGVFKPIEYITYDIPDIMFDCCENATAKYRVRYDVVEGNGEEFSSFMRMKDNFMYTVMSEGGAYTVKSLYYGKLEGHCADPYKLTVSEAFNYLAQEGESKEAIISSFRKAGDRQRFSNKADLGAYCGQEDRWASLFVTKSSAYGRPISVVPGQSFIVTQKNDSNAPEGYKPVCLSGNSRAYDLNSIAYNSDGDTGTPLYMFIPNGKDTSNEVAKGEVKEATQYVTDVRLFYAGSRQEALAHLQKENYQFIDENLTPYSGFTYLGFKMGSESNAITDLRVSTMGLQQIRYGEMRTKADLKPASYAECGLAASDTTPDGVKLYQTSSQAAGTPIVNIRVTHERLPLGCGEEPVCLFNGGNAVDFQHKWSDNSNARDVYSDANGTSFETTFSYDRAGKHAFSLQDDPKNGTFIYFTPKEQFKSSDTVKKPPYVAGFSYFMAFDNKYPHSYDSSRNVSNQEFMQEFAANNGFELVMNGSSPATMMSGEAGKLRGAYKWDDYEDGTIFNWDYTLYHTVYNGLMWNKSDGALGVLEDDGQWKSLKAFYNGSEAESETYFGVSYTYNPYRAITSMVGVDTAFTETTSTSLRYTGLPTQAGAMLPTNLSIQGNSMFGSAVSMSFHNIANMQNPWYLNSAAKQKSDLDWKTDKETEISTRYLMTAGAVRGMAPIRRDDLMFVLNEDPGQYDDYVPICDIRTPGDYEHPMNFAIDTTNLGSRYLYIYLKKSAGGKENNPKADQNVYKKKKYVAAVFCGTGKTPDEALANLFSRASGNWATLSAGFPDINETPTASEFDEIIPYDLSDSTPWYQLETDKVEGDWTYGNKAADERWGHVEYDKTSGGHFYKLWSDADTDGTPDKREQLGSCAYIGVVRTDTPTSNAKIPVIDEKTGLETLDKNGNVITKNQVVRPAYGILKYYSKASSSASTLSFNGTNCTLAGGPVQSKEGQYYIYYSNNTGSAAYSAPILDIDLSKDMFTNGFNSCYAYDESKKKAGETLPSYSSLRMRTDEQMYIHTRYELKDLPYIEALYIGVGNTKKEAWSDMIGTSNANSATMVNCMNNTGLGKWVAIGYRRTSNANSALRDIFCYVGENPPDTIDIPNVYSMKTVKGVTTFDEYTYSAYKRDENGNIVTENKKKVKETHTGVPYNLVKRNLANGQTELLAVNQGSGATPIYLYTCKSEFATDKSVDKEVYPIRNICFGYEDTSPVSATAEQLAESFASSNYGRIDYNASIYSSMSWEQALAYKGDDPSGFKADGSNAFPIDFSYGLVPDLDYKSDNYSSIENQLTSLLSQDMMETFKKLNPNGRKVAWDSTGDRRVRMYIDRGTFNGNKYVPRANAVLKDDGSDYVSEQNYGRIYQTG